MNNKKEEEEEVEYQPENQLNHQLGTVIGGERTCFFKFCQEQANKTGFGYWQK